MHSQDIAFQSCMMQHVKATLVAYGEVGCLIADQFVNYLPILFAYGIMQCCVTISILQSKKNSLCVLRAKYRRYFSTFANCFLKSFLLFCMSVRE